MVDPARSNLRADAAVVAVGAKTHIESKKARKNTNLGIIPSGGAWRDVKTAREASANPRNPPNQRVQMDWQAVSSPPGALLHLTRSRVPGLGVTPLAASKRKVLPCRFSRRSASRTQLYIRSVTGLRIARGLDRSLVAAALFFLGSTLTRIPCTCPLGALLLPCSVR